MIGSIYIIRNVVNDYVYIGSTTKSISERYNKHLSQINCTNFSHYPLYVAMRELDRANFFIDKIVDVEVNDVTELQKIEGEYIQKYISVGSLLYNRVIPGRSKSEWCDENKDSIKKYKNQWYHDNKDRLLEYQQLYAQDNKDKIRDRRKVYYENNVEYIQNYQKQYHESNKERVNARNKLYAQANKDKILERMMQPVQCECGAIIAKCNLKRHRRSQKHINKMENN